MDEEIIFQVKIIRHENDFELVKKELNNIEQMAFENFLKSYIIAMERLRSQDFEMKYQLSGEEDER